MAQPTSIKLIHVRVLHESGMPEPALPIYDPDWHDGLRRWHNGRIVVAPKLPLRLVETHLWGEQAADTFSAGGTSPACGEIRTLRTLVIRSPI